MTQTKTGTLMPDGSRCRKGANCKRHNGAGKHAASTVKAQQIQTKLNDLFDNLSTAPKETTNPPLPEWWDDYSQRNFGYKKEIIQRLGLKDAYVPTFHENAVRYGYLGVETGDKDTQLVVDTDGSYYKSGEKYYCRAWMYKKGKPVAMLRFATYPQGYTPPANEYQYIESVVCDIEVNPEHRGNNYGIEIIRQVEKNIIAGKQLHSGGGYTPEGRKAFGNILPHTHDAKMQYREDFEAGKIPEPSYRSMNFVHDWDMLQPNA